MLLFFGQIKEKYLFIIGITVQATTQTLAMLHCCPLAGHSVGTHGPLALARDQRAGQRLLGTGINHESKICLQVKHSDVK